MELVRWQPFAGLSNLHSVFDDLLDGTFDRVPAQRSLAKWHPAVDVLEGKDAYLIRAELPGMKREDIKLCSFFSKPSDIRSLEYFMIDV